MEPQPLFQVRLQLLERRFAIKMGSELALIIGTPNSNFLTEIMFLIFRKDIVWIFKEVDTKIIHIFGQISIKKQDWSQRRLGEASDLKARPVFLKGAGVKCLRLQNISKKILSRPMENLCVKVTHQGSPISCIRIRYLLCEVMGYEQPVEFSGGFKRTTAGNHQKIKLLATVTDLNDTFL